MIIEEIVLGEKFRDSYGFEGVVTDKTSSSVELFHKRTSDKGIDCKNWYDFERFIKYFKKTETR